MEMSILFTHLVLCSMSVVLSEEIVFYPGRSMSNTFKRPSETKSISLKVDKCYDHKRVWSPVRVTERSKRAADPVFKGHPKTKEDMWRLNFSPASSDFDQTPSLISLLEMILYKYLNDCDPIILYDTLVEQGDTLLIQQFFKKLTVSYSQGKISENNTISEPRLLESTGRKCVHYVLFTGNAAKSVNVIGLQATSKVVVVARSSQWMIQEFLASKSSRNLVNLLVVGKSFKDDTTSEAPYILYTHRLYTDGLGSSLPVVLTSWSRGKLARPFVNLFPSKMTKGYAGHRFAVSAANQPPFVYKRILTDSDGGNIRVAWDGIDYQILKELSLRFNFSFEITETKYTGLGSGTAVTTEVLEGDADIGIAGLYITSERLGQSDMSSMYFQDCATFITLTSTALPRYRAILGPFRWEVWVALIFTYLFGILPLAFSDKHTLRHLYHNSGEVENMFWYVFGTFTNCFTFVGKNSWSKTTKVTTRILIGMYWIFTIIITSCYTGSIIAFVTLPIYPETVDTVDQLLSGFYRVGTLDKGGWQHWFSNTTDPATEKLLKHLEYVPNVESGLKNTTKAFFWPYAFLGSRAQLEYIGQVNFSLESSKRSVLHISKDCFVPFSVALIFPKQSVYSEKFGKLISRMFQTGLIDKIERDVKWDMQRAATGKLLKISTGRSLKAIANQEKGLTLDDTQGMFLLLGAGFLIAAAALLSEWMGGCSRRCTFRRKKNAPSASSADTESSAIVPTPASKPEDNSVHFVVEADGDADSKGRAISSQDIEKLLKHKEDNSKGDHCSVQSEDSLNGRVIEVFAEINDTWDRRRLSYSVSRRSSSVDLDQEIEQIFQISESNKVENISRNHTQEDDCGADVFGEKIDPNLE